MAVYICVDGFVRLDFSLSESMQEEFECWRESEDISSCRVGKHPGLIFSVADAEKVTNWLEEHGFVRAVVRNGAWTAP